MHPAGGIGDIVRRESRAGANSLQPIRGPTAGRSNEEQHGLSATDSSSRRAAKPGADMTPGIVLTFDNNRLRRRAFRPVRPEPRRGIEQQLGVDAQAARQPA